MKKLAFSTLLALAITMVASAQFEGERPEPSFDAVIAHLALTDSQVVCLETNRDAAREAAEPFVDQLRELRRSLRDAGRNGEDTTAIQTEVDGVVASLQSVQEAHVASAQSCLDASQAAAYGELVAAADLRQEVRQAAGLLLIDGERNVNPGPAGPQRRRGGPRR